MWAPRNLTYVFYVSQFAYFDYGMRNKNPCDQFTFYDKAEPDKATKLQKHEISEMLPDTFAVNLLLFFLLHVQYVDIQYFSESVTMK